MELKAILEIVADVVSILGLPILIASIILLIRQLRIQAYQGVYDNMLSIDQFLVEHPELREYLYESKPLPTSDPVEFNRIIAAADMMLTFFEHVAGHKENMSEAKWRGWEEYMLDVFNKSPAMQFFWRTKGYWYDEELKRVLEKRQSK